MDVARYAPQVGGLFHVGFRAEEYGSKLNTKNESPGQRPKRYTSITNFVLHAQLSGGAWL